jgi:hypothetical protein
MNATALSTQEIMSKNKSDRHVPIGYCDVHQYINFQFQPIGNQAIQTLAAQCMVNSLDRGLCNFAFEGIHHALHSIDMQRRCFDLEAVHKD